MEDSPVKPPRSRPRKSMTLPADKIAEFSQMVLDTWRSRPTHTRFREDYGVLVDEQGIMHSKATVQALMDRCQEHLKHSDLELEAIGRRTVVENHPKMVGQFDFDGYFP